MKESLGSYQMNMLNVVPEEMTSGHHGRWDGSPSGKNLTWYNLNKKGGDPTVKRLSADELWLSGRYEYIGAPSWTHPLGRKNVGTIDVRVLGVDAINKCKVKLKVTGPLAADNFGEESFDTGTVEAKYVEKVDGTVEYKFLGGTLKQIAFPKDWRWYPGLQFDFRYNSKTLFLCFEDKQL